MIRSNVDWLFPLTTLTWDLHTDRLRKLSQEVQIITIAPPSVPWPPLPTQTTHVSYHFIKQVHLGKNMYPDGQHIENELSHSVFKFREHLDTVIIKRTAGQTWTETRLVVNISSHSHVLVIEAEFTQIELYVTTIQDYAWLTWSTRWIYCVRAIKITIDILTITYFRFPIERKSEFSFTTYYWTMQQTGKSCETESYHHCSSDRQNSVTCTFFFPMSNAISWWPERYV